MVERKWDLENERNLKLKAGTFTNRTFEFYQTLVILDNFAAKVES